MFAVNDSDLVAIRRAFMKGGRDGALAELRRRWQAVSDAAAPAVLDRFLAMPIEQPPRLDRSQPRRDGPESRRRRPW